jgi:hypothetical protein
MKLKKIIIVLGLMMLLMIAAVSAAECENDLSDPNCEVTTTLFLDPGSYYDINMTVNEYVYCQQPSQCFFYDSEFNVLTGGLDSLSLSNSVVNVSSNTMLNLYGDFVINNQVLGTTYIDFRYDTTHYDADASTYQNALRLTLDPNVAQHVVNSDTIQYTSESWWFNETQIVPMAGEFIFVSFGSSAIALSSPPRQIMFDGVNVSEGVDYNVDYEHAEALGFYTTTIANYSWYNPYAGVSICDGTFTMPCVVANDWQMYTIDQDVPDLDVTLLGTGSRVNILGDLNVVGTVNPSTRCGNVIIGKWQPPYVLNSDGSGIDIDVVIDDVDYQGCIPHIIVSDVQNISGLDVVNPEGLNVNYQAERHFNMTNNYPYVRVTNDVNGQYDGSPGSPISGAISESFFINSLFSVNVDASNIIYSENDVVGIQQAIISDEYPDSGDYVVYKDGSEAVEGDDFEISNFAITSDFNQFSYYVFDSGAYSLAPGEEEIVVPASPVSSSGGSGTSYVVNQDGDIVGATGIVMFDEKDSASAPFLSVGGGSSFDFKSWFSNLFADIKAWFVK